MPAPKTIPMPGQERKHESMEGEIITAIVKGERIMMTTTEAISLINQVSGVLLAYEYSKTS